MTFNYDEFESCVSNYMQQNSAFVFVYILIFLLNWFSCLYTLNRNASSTLFYLKHWQSNVQEDRNQILSTSSEFCCYTDPCIPTLLKVRITINLKVKILSDTILTLFKL